MQGHFHSKDGEIKLTKGISANIIETYGSSR